MIIKKYGNLFKASYYGYPDVIAPTRQQARDILTEIIWGIK